MTREEAIEILQGAIKKPNTKDGYLGQAIDMAIQALSQEPTDTWSIKEVADTFKKHGLIREQEPTFDDECQKDMDEAWEQIQKKRKRIPVTLDLIPCDNAISREAVLNMQYRIDDSATLSTRDVVNVEDIEDLPSVTQKSGKWIAVTNGRGGHECSLCHEYAPSYQDGDEWLTKYCPNCGAKMESEE